MADERKITQKAGAKRIKIGARHFRRLLSDYRDGGAETLISGHRGKPSNNSMPIEKKEKILRKLKSDYQGFGPTLASEKLLERDGIKVSKETVRKIMIEEGLHQPKTRKKDRIHPMRE